MVTNCICRRLWPFYASTTPLLRYVFVICPSSMCEVSTMSVVCICEFSDKIVVIVIAILQYSSTVGWVTQKHTY